MTCYLEALGLQGKPELQHVSGQAHEVFGGVMTSAGIEPDCAAPLQHGAECVRLHQLPCLCTQLLQALVQAPGRGRPLLMRIPEGIEGCRVRNASSV